MKAGWFAGITGLVFGFVMSRIGFTSWDAVHGMFTFTRFGLLLAFVTSVMILSVAWFVVCRASSPKWPRRGFHRGTIPGAIVFGAGWALCGACPTIALVQLGEGQLAAVVTVVGIVVGNWLYAVAHPRFFGWPTSSCVDD